MRKLPASETGALDACDMRKPPASGCADEPQLLRAHPGTDLYVPPLMKRVSSAVGSVELSHIREVVADYQDLIQFLPTSLTPP